VALDEILAESNPETIREAPVPSLYVGNEETFLAQAAHFRNPLAAGTIHDLDAVGAGNEGAHHQSAPPLFDVHAKEGKRIGMGGSDNGVDRPGMVFVVHRANRFFTPTSAIITFTQQLKSYTRKLVMR
jgi:hypothetical protein